MRLHTGEKHLTHTGEKPHQCAHCGRQFKMDSSLTRHVMRRHAPLAPPVHAPAPPAETKKYQCEVCGRSLVAKHVSMHHILGAINKCRTGAGVAYAHPYRGKAVPLHRVQQLVRRTEHTDVASANSYRRKASPVRGVRSPVCGSAEFGAPI